MPKNQGQHQVLEFFWDAIWTQRASKMNKTMQKNCVLETFLASNGDATCKQHAQNPGNTPGSWNGLESNIDAKRRETSTKTCNNSRFSKRFGKQHGRSMKATCAKTWENARFLKPFGKQQGRNIPGSWNLLASNTDATCTQHTQKIWKNNIMD